MGRDDDIESIVEAGRRTRMATPRWLWIMAVVVGAVCALGFAIAMLGEGESPDHTIARRADGAAGFGTGLVIGVAAGIVIGVSIARQRNHSSRSTP